MLTNIRAPSTPICDRRASVAMRQDGRPVPRIFAAHQHARSLSSTSKESAWPSKSALPPRRIRRLQQGAERRLRQLHRRRPQRDPARTARPRPHPARDQPLRLRGRRARQHLRRVPLHHAPQRRQGDGRRRHLRRHAAGVPPPRPPAPDHRARLPPALRGAPGADRHPHGVDRRHLPALRLRRRLDARGAEHRPALDQHRAVRPAGDRHLARGDEGRTAAAAVDVPAVLDAAQRLPAPRARHLGRAGARHRPRTSTAGRTSARASSPCTKRTARRRATSPTPRSR